MGKGRGGEGEDRGREGLRKRKASGKEGIRQGKGRGREGLRKGTARAKESRFQHTCAGT